MDKDLKERLLILRGLYLQSAINCCPLKSPCCGSQTYMAVVSDIEELLDIYWPDWNYENE